MTNLQEYALATGSGKVAVLIDVGGCLECSAAGACLAEVLSGRDDVTVVQLDADESPDLASRLQVVAVPQVRLFRDGMMLASTEQGVVPTVGGLKALADYAFGGPK